MNGDDLLPILADETSKGDADLTPGRERLLLFEHGTRPWKLPPSAVLNTARNDLRKRGSGRPFAFLRKHVRSAKSPADLLRRALHDRGTGLTAPRVETLTLYGDEQTLRHALKLANESEQE
jgi:hypothetical protein